MKAMVLSNISNLNNESQPLGFKHVTKPEPKGNEVLIKIATCGVCHTELDEIEGRTPPSYYPVIPGHQVVGHIVQPDNNQKWQKGDRVGVAWIYSSCGQCRFCQSGRENLCSQFKATGRDINGGYAEYMCAPYDFIVAIPENFSDEEAAPLLCAGAIGYRSLNLTGICNGDRLGLTGFGGSGHQVLKMARHCYPDSTFYVFARSPKERAFALQLGATWAGDINEKSPSKLNAIIDTTPVWTPVVEALKNLEKGGRLVINAIRKQNDDLKAWQTLCYHEHLWMEKEIKSVANVTRNDVACFLQLASEMRLQPTYNKLPLEKANEALKALKNGHLQGAYVLRCDDNRNG